MRKTRKKAVSPVIATLLLILIAVAAAILVYVWVTGYASSMTKTSAPELEEKIKIEAVSYKDIDDDDTKELIVYIRNIGSTTASVSDIYIIRADTSQLVAHLAYGYANNGQEPSDVGDATPEDRDISPNSVEAFINEQNTAEDTYMEPDSTVAVSLSEGVTYIIKAITIHGIEASVQFRIQE